MIFTAKFERGIFYGWENQISYKTRHQSFYSAKEQSAYRDIDRRNCKEDFN